MKTVVFLTLLFICASKQQSRPRSVNLALETVLEFDNNDNSADIQIIEKVKGFLDRIKSVIGRSKISRRSLSSNDYKFTDFVKNAIAILLSYDDDDFEEVLSVVDTEVRKYHYKGCKIYELLENQNVRRFMANQLDVIRDTPAKKIRSRLKKVLRTLEDGNFSSKGKLLVDSVNFLYLGEPKTRYKKFLDNLLHYKLKSKRYDLDLTKVIRDALRNIVFDYYSGLDNKTRRDLRIKLETFWKDYNNPKEDNHQVWQFKPLAKGKAERAGVKKVLNEDISTDSYEISKPTNVKTKKRLKKTKGRKESMRHGPKEYKADREIVEDSHIHDTNIAINVEKDVNKEMPTSSKKARLTFITLYPEKFTFLDTKKSAKTTKSTRHRTAKDEPNPQTSKTVLKKRQEKTQDPVPRHRKKQKKSKPFEREREMKDKHHKMRKPSEMEKMMAEHEKMKKLLMKGSVENTVKEQRLVKKLMAASDEASPGEEEAATREESAVSVKKVSIRKTKSSKRSKHRKQGKIKKTNHNSDSSQADDVSTHVMNKEEKSRKNLEQETHEGLPIESEEFNVASLRKRNVNDSFTNDTKAPSINFIKRIKDLEEELKNVKAQIKDKPDHIEIPTYDNLDFWEGTTKAAEKANITKVTKATKTTKLTTTKATTKTKTKTTTKTKATKKPEFVVLFDKTTTENVNSTYYPVFRSDNMFNISQLKNDVKLSDLDKITGNMLEDANLADKTNISETAHLSDLNNEIDNYTTNIDDDINDPNFDLIYNKNMNITNHIEHLQKYLNSTKDDPNDKGHMVRKKMLNDLTGILAEPEEGGNKTMPVEERLLDKDVMQVADPLSMMDDVDALSLK